MSCRSSWMNLMAVRFIPLAMLSFALLPAGIRAQTRQSAVVPNGETSTWTMTVLREGNQSLLHIQAGGGEGICEAITLPLNGSLSVTLTANESQVLIKSNNNARQMLFGINVTGIADRVSRSGSGGLILTLEGHVHLKCTDTRGSIEVATDRIVLNLVTGHVEVELTPEPIVNPVVPCCTTSGACQMSPPPVVPVDPHKEPMKNFQDGFGGNLFKY
jgi:hypothetical protein